MRRDRHGVLVRGRLADALWTAPAGTGWFETLQRWLHRAFEWLIALTLIGLRGGRGGRSQQRDRGAVQRRAERGGREPPRGRAGAALQLRVLLRDVVRSVLFEALKLAVYGAIMLGLVRVRVARAGDRGALQTVVGGVLTALYFAIDYVDWAASRHGLSVAPAPRLRGRATCGRCSGFGAGVWLLLFVPLLNLLFMPAAVAGGTLLFLDLRREARESHNGVKMRPRPPSCPSSRPMPSRGRIVPGSVHGTWLERPVRSVYCDVRVGGVAVLSPFGGIDEACPGGNCSCLFSRLASTASGAEAEKKKKAARRKMRRRQAQRSPSRWAISSGA